ncbi:MAG: glycosyltransferase [Desulfosoma sp.]
MTRRLKILLSAYACSPFRGSEPGVGWGFVNALAPFHDLWVIVEEEKFREDIETYLAEHPEFPDSVRFFFVRKKRNRSLRRIWPPSYYWYYRAWHRDAFRLARDLHRRVGFDLVHQLTMVGYREPGYLWKLGIPFVWGPVGGMGFFPWRFLHKVGIYGAIYYAGYNLLNALQMVFLSRPRRAGRAAGCGLIAATPENARLAERLWKSRCTVLCEVGLPPALQEHTVRRRSEGEPLRIAWSGQHIPRKALNLGLEALARLPGTIPWELHVLGEGARTRSWKRLARRLGMAHRCRFHGWIPREEALGVLAQAHLFLITSLRDLTSTVTVEALAAGLPIVCPDHCGFAHVVDESCGIRVPVTRPSQTIEALARAVRTLAEDEGLRQRLAGGALARARDFSWDRKAEVVNEIYRKRFHEAAARHTRT